MQKLLETLRGFIKMPGMYNINKVEDIHYILFGARLFCTESFYEEIDNFLSNFKNFIDEDVSKDYDISIDVEWYKFIRLFSSTDKHSLMLFETYFNRFCEFKGW